MARRSRQKTRALALSAMLCALALVIMLSAYLPYAGVIAPELAGVVLMVVLCELGGKWALAAYAAAALLTALLCEKESAMLFVMFFGYYPVLKGKLEHLKSRAAEYLLKILIFNASLAAGYALLIFVFGMPLESLGVEGRGMLILLVVCANLVLIVYDLCLTRLAALYWMRLHPKVQRMMRH